MNYKLTRSKRKTVAIYIRDGGVDVRAPLAMTKQEIDNFVASKEKWITDKLIKSREQLNRRGEFALTYGSTILYRGKGYPIAAKSGSRAGFDAAAFYMPPDLSPEQIKSACVQIYMMLAKCDMPAITLNLAKKMGAMPSDIKINSAKKRWGSCSSRKSINFSWYLIMADDALIEYVVVHELAHLHEMNHSARFWKIVENVLPDYKERQERLFELQKRLAGEDWGR
mgnify:CR=1 FL=1